MLSFATLSTLDKHLQWMQKRLSKNKSAVFLVGGCVRDLLLGVDTQPLDIDITMAGNPEHVYAEIDKKKISHFITEKYGTITLIDKP
jgi:tRNA nucleotidyltransferase/poly(A) polymerase